MAIRTLAILCLAAASCTGCGYTKPRAVSDPIGITLNMNGGDIVGSAIEQRKSIATEVSNPYADFLQRVNQEFGTADVDIRVKSIMVQLQEVSEAGAVQSFGDLFSGRVAVFLAADDAAAGYVVAVGEGLTGSGPTKLDEGPDAGALGGFQTALRTGTFRVGIRGATALPATAKFEAKIAVTVTFGAYK